MIKILAFNSWFDGVNDGPIQSTRKVVRYSRIPVCGFRAATHFLETSINRKIQYQIQQTIAFLIARRALTYISLS